MKQWILIDSFQNETLANIAKGKLESSGIVCQIKLNQAGGTLLGVFGIQNGPCDLLVMGNQVQKAEAVLKM